MIFRQAGGWLKRYTAYRRELMRVEWGTPDGKPMPPISLYDFGRTVDAADAHFYPMVADRWRVGDDRVLGGYSMCHAALVRTVKCWEQHMEKEDREAPTEWVEEEELLEGDRLKVPYIRWAGTLDTTIGLDSEVQRSGFCAIKGPPFPFDGFNLRGNFSHLEIFCRSSVERIYTLNLEVNTGVTGDTYQGYMLINPSTTDEAPFQRVLLPFSELTSTYKGKTRQYSHKLDDNIKIESLGITLMDNTDGDFQFDLARIRAVNLDEQNEVYDPPDTPFWDRDRDLRRTDLPN